MAALVVLCALVFWAGVFSIYFASQGTSLVEFVRGRLEPLPDDLGEWKASNEEAGVVREERLIAQGATLLRQVRYRDAVSREIVRVEPEERVERRRVRP